VLVPGSHERLSRAPQAAEPGRGGGGRARSDLRPGYEQQRDSPLEATLDIVRPAEALQPNSPSCGNQPANISLTAPSRTDTHANSSTLVRPQERRPRSHPGAASPCPLDKTALHISRWWPSVVVVVGHGAAFFLLSQVLKTIGVGLAYATWAGLGTAGAAVGAWLLFGERFSGLAIVGMALIIVGVGVLSLAGTSHA